MRGHHNSSLILVVDDEPVIADTLVMILNQRGFDARAVYSGETAVVIAGALKPDVLISDVNMNGMNGIELMRRVCEELPNCKVVLISGDAAGDELLREAEAHDHHFDFLHKPFDPDQLLANLKKAA